MKMLAYLLAIICIIAAVMYFVMPAGSLPTFMPGYEAGSAHIHHRHALIAAVAARRFVRDRLVHRPAPLTAPNHLAACSLRCTRSSKRATLTTTR
jgi:hypothetical protein